MSKHKVLLATGLLAAGLAANVDAVPYASLVKLQNTVYVSGSNNTISYVLNEAPAGTAVTINILDGSNAVVATFAGTATRGLNNVVWNGRVDNAAGALVADGTGYKVRISVAGPTQAGWTVFGANQSSDQGFSPDIPVAYPATIYADSFPKDIAIHQDPDSDFYGTVLVSTGNASLATGSAWVVLNTALQTVAGDSFAGRVLRHPKDVAGTVGSGDGYNTWGGAWDPVDENRFWSVGQDGTVEILSADNTGGTGTAGLATDLVDADPTHLAGANYYPRTVTVHSVAAQKYLFVARGNSTISAVAINGSNQVSAAPVNIATFATTTRYSKAIRFDSDGNLYFVARRTTGATGGALYRWSPAKVAAALSGTPTPLSEANSDWNIQITVDAAGATDEEAMIGVTIAPDGTVYACESDDGIYSLGNKSQATLAGNLQSVGTLVVNFRTLVTAEVSPGINTLDYAANIASDAQGNLYLVDGGSETVWGFSPPAASATNVQTTGAASQTFSITTVASADANWSIYQ